MAKKKSFFYRSYNFVDKDPVIDKVRTIVQREGVTHQQLSWISGVSATTLYNWFEGQTRRPQHASIMAVVTSLGYRQAFVKTRKVDIEKEVAKAKEE